MVNVIRKMVPLSRAQMGIRNGIFMENSIDQTAQQCSSQMDIRNGGSMGNDIEGRNISLLMVNII